MIRGVHAMFYSAKAAELRAFIRDKLKFPFTDVHDGWLIFDLPSGDLGVHPTDFPDAPVSGTHNISFFTDDIRTTVAELKSRGVEFTCDIRDAGYGLVTAFKMPGDVEVELYQPHYKKNG